MLEWEKMMPRSSKLILFVSTITLFQNHFTVSARADTEMGTSTSVKVLELIDKSSGLFFKVSPDKESVLAYDIQSKLIWETNVIKVCGKPAIGSPEIRHLSIAEERLRVVSGKHDFASIALSTGDLRCEGAD